MFMMKKHIAKLLVLAVILSLLPFTVAADIPATTQTPATVEKQAADTGLINSMTFAVTDGTADSGTPKLEWLADEYTTSLDVILLEGKDKVTLDISYAVNENVSVKGYKNINFRPVSNTPSEPASGTNKFSFSDLERGTHFFWLVATKDQITNYYHITVRVTDATTEHSINVSCQNGSATVSAAKAVAGTEITVTTTPNEGYTLATIYFIADGATRSTLVTDNKFVMPGADITVFVNFIKVMRSVIVAPTTNGTATIAATDAPAEGTTVTVSTTPDEGYKLGTIVVTGTDDSNVTVTNGSFIMPAQDVTVTVTFVPKDADDYDVRIDKDVKNGIIAANPTAAPAGTDVLLTVIPTTNYKLDTFKVTTQAGVEVETTAVEGGYKFTMPEDARSVIVMATFRGIGPNAEKHRITITDAVHGSVSTYPANEAPEDECVYITAIPDDGYVFDSAIVKDANGTVNVDGGTFLMPGTDVTLTVTFKKEDGGNGDNSETDKPKDYTINFDAAPVGGSVRVSVNGVEANKAHMGDKIVVTAAPNEGYKFDSLTVGGETVEATAGENGAYTYSFELKTDTTIAAQFSEIENPPTMYKVTFTEPENGSLSVRAGSAAVESGSAYNEGTLIAVTAAPGEGYKFDSLTVGGKKVQATAGENGVYTYSFELNADTAIAATFIKIDAPAPVAHKITVKAEPAGSGTAEPDVRTAKEGEKVTLTIKPADKYLLTAITINSKPVHPLPEGEMFTFEMLNEDVEVVVTFKEVLVTPDVEPGNKIDEDDIDTSEYDGEDKGHITEVVSQSEIRLTDDVTKEAEDMAASAAANEDLVKRAVEELGVTDAGEIKFVAKPTLEMQPKSLTKGDKPVFTLHIEAFLQVFAEKKNATAADKPVKLDSERRKIEKKEPVEISIVLPDIFNPTQLDLAFVGHIGYQYRATKSSDNKFTFINPHGFSDFAIGAVDETVAANDNVSGYTYLTLAAAAEEAEKGDTLTIKKTNSESVTLDKGVKVKLDKDVKFNGKINGSSVTFDENGEYVVKTTTSGDNNNNSSSTGSGGGGGGSSKPAIKPGTDTDRPTTPTTTPGGGVAGFNDVATSAWYADSVKYVVDKGLFGGVGNGNFAPNANMTRAMMWTVLARYMGVNTNSGSNWYEAARTWTIAQNISDGTMADGNVTREQFVTMLWRLSGEPTATTSASFTDNGRISGYAKTAVDWAVAQGILNGYNDGSFRPQGSATRAEVAKMLTVFCTNAENAETPDNSKG